MPQDQRNSASAIHHPKGSGPRLFFQQVPEQKSAKNRVHLDVRGSYDAATYDQADPRPRMERRMAALEAECDRLVALGATRTRRFEPEPPKSFGFIVMADPEGNEFCLD